MDEAVVLQDAEQENTPSVPGPNGEPEPISTLHRAITLDKRAKLLATNNQIDLCAAPPPRSSRII